MTGLNNGTKLQTPPGVRSFLATPNHLPSILIFGLLVLAPISARAGIIDTATAFWDFEGADPLLDKTGNGHNLTGTGPTFGTPAPSANGWAPAGLGATSANFTGSISSGTPLSIPNSVYSGGDFTVMLAAFRRTAGFTGHETFLASTTFRHQISGNNHFLNTNVGGGGTVTTSFAHDTWHFMSLRYNSATNQIEGLAETNSGILPAQVSLGTGNLSSSTNFRLGSDGVSLIGGFDGLQGELDFVAFQDGLLSDVQIQEALTEFVQGIATVPALVPEPASLAIWSLLGLVGAGYSWRRRNRRE